MGLERVVAVEKESCFLWGFLEGGGIVLKALSDTGEHKAGGAVGCARALLQGHAGAAAPPGWAPSHAGEHPGVVGMGQRLPGPSWPVPVVPGTSGCCVAVGRCCAGTRSRSRPWAVSLCVSHSWCALCACHWLFTLRIRACSLCLGIRDESSSSPRKAAPYPAPPPRLVPAAVLAPSPSPGLVWDLQETEETFCASL